MRMIMQVKLQGKKEEKTVICNIFHIDVRNARSKLTVSE